MIQYTSIGHGKEKVMVVHGWKIDHTCFDGMHSSLDKELFTYVFVDQRGYGKSINMEGPYDVPQVANDMIDLADKLGWEDYHVIGHSMGGKVIQRIMADEEKRIKSAIGVTPVPAVKLEFDEPAWDMFSKAADDPAVRMEVFRVSTGHRLTETWYQMMTQQSIKACKVKAFSDYLDSWVNYAFVPDIEGNKTPIKVIVGEFDPDLTYDVMKATYGAWFPNVEITQLGNCGHYPMFETPLSLAVEWETFLRKHCG